MPSFLASSSRVMPRGFGRPLKRQEDPRLITGAGLFSDDVSLPGQVHACFVRSPHPHARIRTIDAAAALATPGVLAVLTGRDAAGDGLADLPHRPVPTNPNEYPLGGRERAPIFVAPFPALPVDRARFAGEAVAMVVAETAALAADAASLVAVDWEPLAAVTATRDAGAAGAPVLWDALGVNVCVDSLAGDARAADAAFAAATHVVRLDTWVPRITGVPMEPRAALGVHDPVTGRLTLYAGSGGSVRLKTDVAEVLGVPEAAVRVIARDVGGNYGTRNSSYPEYPLVMWAARRLGRPVKWTGDRREMFLSDYRPATWSPRWSWPSTPTAASWPSAGPTPATWARTRSRSSRSTRAASCRPPCTGCPRRRCAGARCTATPRRSPPTAARGGPR